MASAKRWIVWDENGRELLEPVQVASDNNGQGLLKAVGIDDVEHFGDNTGDTIKLVQEIFRAHPDRAWYLFRITVSTYFKIDRLLSTVREQLKEKFKINEVNSDGSSLLRDAVRLQSPDAVQLLVVHGADPNLGYDPTGRILWQSGRQYDHRCKEIESILCFKNMSRAILDSIEARWSDHDDDLPCFQVAVEPDLSSLAKLPPFTLDGEDFSAMAWIHIPRNNVPLILAVARAIERHFEAEDWRPSRGYIVDYFIESFSSPAVSVREARLNYRDAVFDTKQVRFWRPATDLVVVMPCLAMQSIRTWRSRDDSYRKYEKLNLRSSGNDEPLWNHVYAERTLAETHYPRVSAAVLKKRNHAQIIQQVIGKVPESEEDLKPILMIPRLWVWVVDNVLVTAHPLGPAPTAATEAFRSTEYVHLQLAIVLKVFIAQFGKDFYDSESKRLVPSVLDTFEGAVVELQSDFFNSSSAGETAPMGSKISAVADSNIKTITYTLDIQTGMDMIQAFLLQQKKIVNDGL